MRRRAVDWPLAALVVFASIVTAQADTLPTVSLRVGNHEGYGRVVFRLPSSIGYSVVQDGQRAIVKFAANLSIGAAAAIPRNMLSITSGTNQAELVIAPGSVLHDWRLGDLVVIDALDPIPAGKGLSQASAADGQQATPATVAAPPTAPTPPRTPPTALPAVAAQPTAPPVPGATPAGPAPSPPSQPAEPAPSTASPETPVQPSASQPPAEPVQPVAAQADDQTASDAENAIVVQGDAALGVAAFRRGNSALIVFDERRVIDTTPLRDDPVLGTASVQMLPTATVVRVQIEPSTSLSLSRSAGTWHITSVPSEPSLRPIRATGAEDRITLAADAPGSVVTFADPDTGATVLVGTQRSNGQGVPTERRAPGFSLLPTWQGVAVQVVADTVVLQPTAQGFALAGVPYLSSTPAVSELSQPLGLTRRYDFPSQSGATLQAKLRRQVVEAASAPARARGPLRQAVARTMIALGLGAEASALLRFAAADDPEQATSVDSAALTAIAALLANRPDEAEALNGQNLPTTDDIALWRAVRVAQLQDGPARAAPGFAATLPLLLAYPAEIRDRLLPLAAETLVAGGELTAAAALLGARQQDSSLDLARAMLLQAKGDNAGALAGYDRVAQSRDQYVHARAAVRAVELRLATGAIDPGRAVEGLESLLYAWRGDHQERALRERLADLKASIGAWRSALALQRETETLFPSEKAVLHAKLTDMFAALLRGDATASLPPLEFVAVVEENADLLPGGPDGDALQSKLADRLLALDLTKRAGPVLEKLMQAANSGAARAGFGARLAALRSREGDPAGALAALEASLAPDLPAELTEQRTLLAAAAYARRGDNQQALAALDGLDVAAADEARATILERANDWAGAQRALTAYVVKTVPAEGKLDEAQRRALLRLATAAARAGDDTTLAGLRQRETGRMETGPLADMFRLLTADQVRSVADLQRSGREAALARGLAGQLKAIQAPAGQIR
jgi:hypothetical protein